MDDDFARQYEEEARTREIGIRKAITASLKNPAESLRYE
jgi:hypothetical protein